MRLRDLEAFDDVPFLFWVKNRKGAYVWGNKMIRDYAGEDVAGKTDKQLWPDDADDLWAADLQVFDTGEPTRRQEHLIAADGAQKDLHVCKWLDNLDGEPCSFGISFTYD